MKQVNEMKAIQVKLLFLSFLLCLFLMYPKFYHQVQADERIQIYTIMDLDDMRNCLTCDYILMNDLDLTHDTRDSSGLLYHDGLGWNPIGTFNNPFEGSFDGNGHRILGLTINKNQNYIGLFSRIARTTNKDKRIENLILEDVDISGIDYVGAIAGNIEYAHLDRVSISGTVNGRMYVGGVTGYSYYTFISQVYSKANITGLSTGIGGVLGRLGRSSQVSDVHVEGTVMGTACQDSISTNCSVGGIVGRDESTSLGIFSSFFNGQLIHQVLPEFWVNPLKYAQPILGVSYGGLVANNYHTDDNTFFTQDFVHQDDLLNSDTYDGFDFNETWVMSSRPVLIHITRFEVSFPLVIGIEIYQLPLNLVFDYGETLNLEGLVVITRYNDDSIEIIEDYVVLGEPTMVGVVNIMISYQEFETSFSIQVNEISKFQLRTNMKGFGGQLEIYCHDELLVLPTEIVHCEIELRVLLEPMGRILDFSINQKAIDETMFIIEEDSIINIEFYMLGDLNQDSRIDFEDFELMIYALHTDNFDFSYLLDTNEDGKFNIADLVFLRRHLLKGKAS